MVLTAACVLRSGGEYVAEHVGRLRAGVARYLPGMPMVCLSDVDVPCQRIPLQHNWPGWWSKMELMRPDIEGDLLYLDLDTVLVGRLDEIASVGRLTLLRDFYHPERLGSGLMYLPAAARRAAWAAWTMDPAGHMERSGPYGDQGFLLTLWRDEAARWQDTLPGQVISYKVDVRDAGMIPAGARVVCFHGEPRPWAVGWLDDACTPAS